MLVNKEKFKLSITEILMAVISLVMVVGIRTWFAGCPVMSETIMSCHWAEAMLKVMSVLFLIFSVLHIVFADQKIKLGMDIPFFCICIVTIFIPGGMINLCGSADMACRHAMKPWTIIICVILAVAVLADIILYASQISKEKHQRKVRE